MRVDIIAVIGSTKVLYRRAMQYGREDMIIEMAHLRAEMAGLYRALRECGMNEEAIQTVREDSASDFLSALAALRKRHGLPAA